MHRFPDAAFTTADRHKEIPETLLWPTNFNSVPEPRLAGWLGRRTATTTTWNALQGYKEEAGLLIWESIKKI